MDKMITLDYGSGGRKTSALIEELIVPAFDNAALSALSDGAVLEGAGRLAFSTDSFVVSPCFFPGGDIGKLAVCGTVNDLCMCGAEPKYLSLSLILEEGFSMEKLAAIIDSAARTARECGVHIVTGDTKVVERGRGDGVYINTAGIGFMHPVNLSPDRMEEGDLIVVSGPVGEHGIAVMMERNGMEGDIRSDCGPLVRLSAAVLDTAGARLKLLRDPTRGGLATTLCEFVENRALSIELAEEDIPVAPAVSAACDLLGIDPLYAACEGRLVAVVSQDAAEDVVRALRAFPEGAGAAVIGRVTRAHPGKLVLRTALGGGRVLMKLTGAQLPRIC